MINASLNLLKSVKTEEYRGMFCRTEISTQSVQNQRKRGMFCPTDIPQTKIPLQDKEFEIYNLFLLGEELSGIYHAYMVVLKVNQSETKENRDRFCPTDLSHTKIYAFMIKKGQSKF